MRGGRSEPFRPDVNGSASASALDAAIGSRDEERLRVPFPRLLLLLLFLASRIVVLVLSSSECRLCGVHIDDRAQNAAERQWRARRRRGRSRCCEDDFGFARAGPRQRALAASAASAARGERDENDSGPDTGPVEAGWRELPEKKSCRCPVVASDVDGDAPDGAALRREPEDERGFWRRSGHRRDLSRRDSVP